MPADLAGGGDGVNVLDIIALIKIIFGTSPAPQPGTAFFQAADVNGDGNIDVLDIVKLVNIILNPPQVKAVVVDLSEPAYMSLGVMQVVEHRPLIWDTFFSTKIDMEDQVEYPLNRLHEMSRNELKSVYDAFFYRIYFQHFQDYGLSMEDIYDPGLLSLLGLPSYASLQDIKRRYRELAQRYHPDHGGTHDKFIELVDVYEQLRRKV